ETSLVSVVGGTVRSQQYHAILNDAPQGVISISGGTIEASVDWTVRVEGEDSNITVTGGSISNEFGSALSAVGPHSYVSVSGGSVCSYADRPVIEGRRVSVSGNAWVEAYGGGEALKGIGIDSEVYVSGGTVCANTGFAILTDDKGMVEISGGFVFCYGKIVGGTNSDVVLMFQGEPAIVGNSVVCAWDAPSGVPTYAEASSTALTVNSGATAKWGTSGDQVGIYYSNSGNSGFFSLYGDIIITPAGTPATPSTPSTGPGSGEEAGDPEEGDTEDGSGSDAGKQAEKPDLPSSQGDTEDSEETPESGSTGGGFNPLWILFAVLVLVAIGCGIAYMQSRKKAAAAEAQAAAAEAQAAAAASTQPLSSVDSTVELPNNTNGPSNNT
ncbi:MAG: hypothetical protein FWD45_00635, partial [Coriobacteriia bacterium]|nr:hypothetical protein [Coriobacteriia bacterium]